MSAKSKKIPIPVQDRPELLSSFIGWWTLVNAVGLADLILTGPYALANLETDTTAYMATLFPVTDKQNTVQSLAQQMLQKEALTRSGIVTFHRAVAGFLPGHPWDPLNEPVPRLKDSPDKHRAGWMEVRSLWGKINANVPPYPGFAPPLVLPSSTLAQFVTLTDDLQTIYVDWKQAQEAYREAVKHRDSVFRPIYERLKQLREAVFGFLPEGHPLLETIPDLTYDGNPAGTPDAPVASGAYDAPNEEGDVSWTITEDETEVDKFVVEKALVDGLSGISSYSTHEELPASARATSIPMGGIPTGQGIAVRIRIVMLSGNYATSNAVTIIVLPSGGGGGP